MDPTKQRAGKEKPKQVETIAQPEITQEDLSTLKETIDSTAIGAIIPFTKLTLKQGELEYALIGLTDRTSKLVFHFCHVSPRFMNELGKFFWEKVKGRLVTDADTEASIEAGENPIFRSNWDVVIFNINKYKAPMLMTTILGLLKKEFSA